MLQKKNKKKKWNYQIAQKIALKYNIFLTLKHWYIVSFIRNFYKKYQNIPTLKMIIISISKKYKISLNTQTLFVLFPKKPLQIACQISGLSNIHICS
ncbi:TusE/DsrC/DsvC family sulfur relay protein [Buchnera aphidicola]|uniref:Sulfurtransferase n=1 Tax=Buchnera aphidicola subsp. Tuberolachnus salignus TaxID=98804 RepID=A0A170PC72_BUCTT|nr:TusE/DsrC/DsvC family sulfur relay protein [Buchnera aphidicola]CUR53273.1 Sulfurtransferase TusE [Buchnera aphidicola (Tuberolachnus salignus)]